MRNRFMIIILVLLGSLDIVGQTIEELDEKNGFKQFKLGSNISEIKDKIEEKSFLNNPKIKSFMYTGTDIEEVFSVPVSGISLTYFNNQLESITILFSDFEDSYTDEEYYTVTRFLEEIFGKEDVLPVKLEDDLVKGKTWNGEEVILESLQYYTEKYEKAGAAGKYGCINIISKKLSQEMMNSEF